jgi:hypothetical protein
MLIVYFGSNLDESHRLHFHIPDDDDDDDDVSN